MILHIVSLSKHNICLISAGQSLHIKENTTIVRLFVKAKDLAMQHIKIMIFILAFHSLWASANDGLTFKCEFKTSFSTKAWPDEKINVQKGKGFSEPLYFTEIKSNNQHAKMIGNAGTASVYVIMDSEKIHLIELTPALNIVVTTIFYNEKICLLYTSPSPRDRG